MGRIRTIKPEFPQSESMGRVSRDARLLFIQLWTLCDDEGRTRADSRMIARLLYPYDDGEEGHFQTSTKDVDRWFAELEREQCVFRYQADGTTYAQIAKWLNHQKIDRPSKSKIPEFDESSLQFAIVLDSSTTDLDQGSRIKEGNGEDHSSTPDSLREVGGGKKRKPKPVDPEDEKCARWLYGRLLKANEEAKKPNWSTWAKHIRLMREQDGRTHRQICELYDWAKSDSFWSGNIISPEKLREKWDTLVEHRARPGRQQAAATPKQSNMDATLAAAERAKALIFGIDGEGANAAG